MQVYLVGGAVRDSLLKRHVTERDYVVVGATPKQMLDLGFHQVGADFPVFLHPNTHEEFALARTERKTGQGYLGFTVHTSPDVTLAEDLIRRDLTINAMAIEVNGLFDNTIKTGEIIDPYHGQIDLQKRQLRHVSQAFTEDPVRVLRLARFASRYASLGFQVANDTQLLIKQMQSSGELNNLVAERVWTETQRAIMQTHGDVYFTTLQRLGVLSTIMPEFHNILYNNSQQWQTSAECLRQAHHFQLNEMNCFALLMSIFLPFTTEHQNLLQAFYQRLKIPKQYQQFTNFLLSEFNHLTNFSTLNSEEMFTLLKCSQALKQADKLQHALICTSIYQLTKNQLLLNHIIHELQSISIQHIDSTLTGKQIGNAIDNLRLTKLISLLKNNRY